MAHAAQLADISVVALHNWMRKLGPPHCRLQYATGTAFLSEIFRAGGFTLINQLLAHPPMTTAQVLHPLKYLHGVSAVPVRAPEPPTGYRRVASGSLGELRIGVMLAAALPPREARFRAEGWAGDGYTIVERNGTLGLLWSTVWDDDGAATRFEAALRTAEEKRAEGSSVVRRDGRRVALVRGLDASNVVSTADVLLLLPGEAPPLRPPLGNVTMPTDAPDKIEGGRYASERLGVIASIPDGFEATAGTGLLEGFAIRRGTARGMFHFVPANPPSAMLLLERVWQRETLHQRHLEWEGEVKLALGSAREQCFGRARAVVVSACAGHASYLLFVGWEDIADQAILDGWLGSFRPNGATPVCDEVGSGRVVLPPVGKQTIPVAKPTPRTVIPAAPPPPIASPAALATLRPSEEGCDRGSAEDCDRVGTVLQYGLPGIPADHAESPENKPRLAYVALDDARANLERTVGTAERRQRSDAG